MTHTEIAIRLLDAAEIEPGQWAYYDDATSSYWVSSTADLTALGRMVHAGTPDAYSIWCSSSVACEMPAEWSPA